MLPRLRVQWCGAESHYCSPYFVECCCPGWNLYYTGVGPNIVVRVWVESAGLGIKEAASDADTRQQAGASSSGRPGHLEVPSLAGTTYEAVLLALLEGLRSAPFPPTQCQVVSDHMHLLHV